MTAGQLPLSIEDAATGRIVSLTLHIYRIILSSKLSSVISFVSIFSSDWIGNVCCHTVLVYECLTPKKTTKFSGQLNRV